MNALRTRWLTESEGYYGCNARWYGCQEQAGLLIMLLQMNVRVCVSCWVSIRDDVDMKLEIAAKDVAPKAT